MRRNLLVILCFFALFILPIKSVNAGRTSYVLMCKGGGDMNLKLSATKLEILAHAGFNAANPAPGECVWVDRGFRMGEFCVNIPFEPYMGFRLIMDSNMLQKVKNIVVKNGRVDASFSDNKLKYLYDAIKNGRSFQLHVYRDQGCHYTITKIGP